MWDETLAGVNKHLLTYTKHEGLTILGERPNGLENPTFPKMDHLVCFMPGTIALGATSGKTLNEAKKSPSWGKKQEDEMSLARELMKTCWGMYKVTKTGLAPEIAHFHTVSRTDLRFYEPRCRNETRRDRMLEATQNSSALISLGSFRFSSEGTDRLTFAILD